MIKLYTAPTPNGYKVSCLLEILQMPYEYELVNLFEKEQFSDQFKKISPNSKIPAIEDTKNNFALAESGAIMIYLADKAGKMLPKSGTERYEVLQWIMFQMGHIGPMMGQANVFYRYLPEKIPAAISRYQNECRRLFEVMNNRLSIQQWLCEEFSIADLANWCWIRTHSWSGIKMDGLDHLERWLKEIKDMPGIKEGLDIPIPLTELKKIRDEKRVKNADAIVQK